MILPSPVGLKLRRRGADQTLNGFGDSLSFGIADAERCQEWIGLRPLERVQ